MLCPVSVNINIAWQACVCDGNLFCVSRWPICLTMVALFSSLSSWLFGVGPCCFCFCFFYILRMLIFTFWNSIMPVLMHSLYIHNLQCKYDLFSYTQYPYDNEDGILQFSQLYRHCVVDSECYCSVWPSSIFLPMWKIITCSQRNTWHIVFYVWAKGRQWSAGEPREVPVCWLRSQNWACWLLAE